MPLVYALHTIHHVKGGKQAVQAPGAVFELSDKDVADMKRQGAVRDPSEQEVQLHQLATGQLVPAGSKAAKTPAAPVVEAPAETPAAPNDGIG
jgi:hypothetical protein